MRSIPLRHSRQAVAAPRVGRRCAVLPAVVGLLALAPPASRAAQEEIQVYMDDLRAPGQLGVDVHNNFVVSGRATPDYPGEQPPAKVYRLTPEFAYGLSSTTELGAYLLTSRDPDGHVHGDGVKARIKFVAPHDAQAGPFWGANLEAGRSSRRVCETAWNAELKGIAGYRMGAWTTAVNPNLDWSLSKGGGPVTGDVDLKLNHALSARTQIGIESYNELGPLRHLSTAGTNARTVFGVLDTDFGTFDLNIGVGRAISQSADRWVVKFIVGTNL